MNTLISNHEEVEKKIKKIKESGYELLHILADFDRTLTYGTVDGIKTPSIISMLRDGKHLTENYAVEANALFNKYHPIEIDPNIPLSNKKLAMQEWRETVNKLLIESGLSKADLVDIATNGHVKFRDGMYEFLDMLHEKKIPLVILSASGCGDAIELFFKHHNRNYPNIFYVTNQFNWDENGKALGTKGPIIHGMNKDETVLKNIPEIYEKVKDRKNVILLGDSISDLGMIEGFEYTNLLKIGLLNNDFDLLRDEYTKNFDIVLEGDGDFEEVNRIIKQIS
ncbi:MAG: hypothetical protein WCO66_02105 [Candidatus Absconditabacteria bacterium]